MMITKDREIGDLINSELKRQQDNIELIASENIVSQDVLLAQGSILTNKYAEGYPNVRYYGGCSEVDKIENLAIERATKIFNCKYANVQPHSGSQANAGVYLSFLKPHDTILGMDLGSGGHLTHGSKVSSSGKLYNAYSYGVNKDGLIDYDEVLKIAKECQPKLIICGASAYARVIDFAKFRQIADQVNAILLADVAHIAGLIVAKEHPSPFPHAHVVTTTTHKTLRGPRGGMILTNDEKIIKKINSAIFPGYQGGPLMHIIAAKAVAFKEAMSDDFKDYIKQVISNMKAMENVFKQENIDILCNGSDNHLMVLNLINQDVTGAYLQDTLDAIHITCNKNSIPNDPNPPRVTSGLRIGTAAITTRGFKEAESQEVAQIITRVIKECNNNQPLAQNIKDNLKNQVLNLTSKLPIYNNLKY